MKHLPRILAVLAVACMLMLFLFPMWRITLFAPQYPDGVTMYIHIDKIDGNSPGTLQNVNILNHYVGMKYIEPDAIPELKYFPWVIIGLAAFGLLAALFNRKGLYLAWLLVLVTVSALGLYDFYLWEYDYGHNLSPTAPIKIPEASFQPPLLGTKIILNFVAQSYPAIGGIFFSIGIFLSGLAWWLKGRTFGTTSAAVIKRPAATAGAVALMVLLLTSCTVEPQPIEYGADACDFCQMTIVDRQHAAEAVTEKGKVYKFDAIECMAGWLREQQKLEFAHLLVNDFTEPGEWIPAPESAYLISPAIPSPMGANLSAFRDRAAAEKLAAEKGGEVYDWLGVQHKLGQSTVGSGQ